MILLHSRWFLEPEPRRLLLVLVFPRLTRHRNACEALELVVAGAGIRRVAVK
jgi:hypothetical protein